LDAHHHGIATSQKDAPRNDSSLLVLGLA
jgi:hypothetical protein